MATNPWAAVNSGAWASQVDEEEAAGTLGNPLAAPEEAFPDLAVAATKKQSKRDKGKKQTVSLAEFQTGKKAYAPPTRGRTAAKEEIVLPSGPRARDDDDDGNSRGGLGGAFAGRDYKDKVGGFRDRDDDDGRVTFGREDDGPSRADTADSWGGEKKFQPSGDSGFGSRRGGFDDDGDRGAREDMGPSKADTSASWGSKTFEPSADRGSARGGAFGDSYTARDKSGGFADKYGEDRATFVDRGPSKADEEDRWSRKAVLPSSDRERDSGRGFGASSSEGNADRADRWSRSSSAAPVSTNGTAGPTERKRLNLTARTAPPPLPPPAPAQPLTTKEALEEETQDQNTKPATETKPAEDAPVAAPKPKSNPFGTARPREEVLKEQGRDWKREERALEHSRVKRDPSEEEMQLGDKIAAFQRRIEQGEADKPADTKTASTSSKDVSENSESPEVVPEDTAESAAATPAPVSWAAVAKPQPQEGDEEQEEQQAPKGEQVETVQQALDRLEADLAKLTAELDDKVRFSKGGSMQRESRWK